MKVNFRIGVALAGALSGMFSFAAEKPLSIDRAVDLALRRSPELRASDGRVAAASGRAYQAGRWSNPELEFNTEDYPVSSGNFRDSKNTIGVSQTVPWFGKKKLDRGIGHAEVRESEAERELRKLELVRQVRLAFYRTLAFQELATVSHELQQLAASLASTAQKRVQAGAAADQEQLRAEIQSDQVNVAAAMFQRELAETRRELAMLTGNDVAKMKLEGALDRTWPEIDVAEQRRRLSAHPAASIAAQAVQRSEFEVRRARLEPYPDLRLGVDGGREGREDTAIVQFRVSLPLPILDRSKGLKREVAGKHATAQAEEEAVHRQLFGEWQATTQRLESVASQVALYRDRIVPKSREALRLVQAGYNEGKFGFIDLLDTQRTAAEARLEYARKLLELQEAKISLEYLLGDTFSGSQVANR